LAGKLILYLAAVAISTLLTFAIRRFALRSGLLDIPNQRSSHSVPTPRGGGLAIVLTTSVGIWVLELWGVVPLPLLLALLGGILVAFVGFIDDRRPTPTVIRLAAHIGAAVWALIWLGGVPAIQMGDVLWHWGPFGAVAGVAAIVWSINLFNFMDGIDGIAASEAIFVLCGAAALNVSESSLSALPSAELLLASACLGFLVFNWPPARIFMGDVGSGYLGYGIAALAFASSQTNPTAPFVWLTLGGVFFVDATTTLVRRIFRGERVDQAHRNHAYQWMARRCGSHARVTLGVAAINCFWLLPCAWCELYAPRHAAWLACLALAPLLVAVLWAGAGRAERPAPSD
jgi:Fuc2NAc and GlcNAc transferase